MTRGKRRNLEDRLNKEVQSRRHLAAEREKYIEQGKASMNARLQKIISIGNGIRPAWGVKSGFDPRLVLGGTSATAKFYSDMYAEASAKYRALTGKKLAAGITRKNFGSFIALSEELDNYEFLAEQIKDGTKFRDDLIAVQKFRDESAIARGDLKSISNFFGNRRSNEYAGHFEQLVSIAARHNLHIKIAEEHGEESRSKDMDSRMQRALALTDPTEREREFVKEVAMHLYTFDPAIAANMKAVEDELAYNKRFQKEGIRAAVILGSGHVNVEHMLRKLVLGKTGVKLLHDATELGKKAAELAAQGPEAIRNWRGFRE